MYCPIVSLDQNYVANDTRIFATKEIDTDCGGSLRISHAKQYDLAEGNDIRLGGKRKDYPNLRKGFRVLRENVVLHVEAYGCDCWEIYNNPHFRGKKEDIVPGYRHYLNVRTGSIRKIVCKWDENDFDDK